MTPSSDEQEVIHKLLNHPTYQSKRKPHFPHRKDHLVQLVWLLAADLVHLPSDLVSDATFPATLTRVRQHIVDGLEVDVLGMQHTTTNSTGWDWQMLTNPTFPKLTVPHEQNFYLHRLTTLLRIRLFPLSLILVR